MVIEPADIKDKLRRLTVSKSTVEFLDQDLGRGAYGRLFKVWYHGSVCTAKEIALSSLKLHILYKREDFMTTSSVNATTAANSTIPIS